MGRLAAYGGIHLSSGAVRSYHGAEYKARRWCWRHHYLYLVLLGFVFLLHMGCGRLLFPQFSIFWLFGAGLRRSPLLPRDFRCVEYNTSRARRSRQAAQYKVVVVLEMPLLVFGAVGLCFRCRLAMGACSFHSFLMGFVSAVVVAFAWCGARSSSVLD